MHAYTEEVNQMDAEATCMEQEQTEPRPHGDLKTNLLAQQICKQTKG
jgi:hypothetical protein